MDGVRYRRFGSAVLRSLGLSAVSSPFQPSAVLKSFQKPDIQEQRKEWNQSSELEDVPKSTSPVCTMLGSSSQQLDTARCKNQETNPCLNGECLIRAMSQVPETNTEQHKGWDRV